MRIAVLTLLALVAFAANSVLTRAALVGGDIDAASFTLIRIASGAVMLAALLALRGDKPWTVGSWASAAALMVYAVAFAFAYNSLDAGLGALILFGMVQLTMFAGGLATGERPSLLRWAGMGLGMAGLVLLLLPGAARPPALGLGLMLIAGIGWGVYSLQGRKSVDALANTAGNFLRASPIALVVWLGFAQGPIGGNGAMFAVASGALASGLGYAIWYAALPRLDASLAAVAQLSVPIIALWGGVIWLDEGIGLRFAIASVMVLGGVGVAVFSRSR